MSSPWSSTAGTSAAAEAVPQADDELVPIESGSAADSASAVDERPVTDVRHPVRERRAPDVRAVLPYLTAAAATAWFYRLTLVHGLLPGNIGDARWTIAVHEHWYRVWQGLDSIRDLQYYFPLHNTLGTSDAFLVQGQLYSLGRLFGAGPVNAWLLAMMVCFLVGTLGVATLARQLFQSVWLQIGFVALAGASYPVVGDSGHPQLIGFLATSWVVVGLIDLSRGRMRRGLMLVAAVPPLLALSSWYAAVLIAIVLALLALCLLITARAGVFPRLGRRLLSVLRGIVTPPGVLAVVLGVAGWAAVLWVYLRSRGILPPSEWSETVIYSPRWSDIWNASDLGGGIWGRLYDRVYDPSFSNPEQRKGFTPIVLVVFAMSALVAARTRTDRTPRLPDPEHEPAGEMRDATRAEDSRRAVLAAALTVAAVVALFLVDERGLGLCRPFWYRVPGLESIRSPYRVMEILYALVFFVILKTVELRASRDRNVAHRLPHRARTVVAAVILTAVVGGLFTEMQRPPQFDWTRDQLLPPELQAEVQPTRAACDAVVVAPEAGDPEWLAPVNAVMFSLVSELPTPQGYSRADPQGYPPVVTGYELRPWIEQHGFHGRLCRVTPQGVEVLSGR